MHEYDSISLSFLYFHFYYIFVVIKHNKLSNNDTLLLLIKWLDKIIQ